MGTCWLAHDYSSSLVALGSAGGLSGALAFSPELRESRRLRRSASAASSPYASGTCGAFHGDRTNHASALSRSTSVCVRWKENKSAFSSMCAGDAARGMMAAPVCSAHLRRAREREKGHTVS